jgi:hypothetical protein
MSPIWAVVVGLLIAVAAALSVGLWALVRERRAREAARVQLLQELAFPGPLAQPATPSTADAWDIEFESERETADGAMFRHDVAPGAPPRRWLAIVGVSLLMAATVGVYALGHRPRPAALSDAPVVKSPAQAAAGVSRVPIELVALQHEMRAGRLVVTGALRNPAGAAPLTNVEAVVDLFDRSDHVLATERTRIDRELLAPGASAAFSVAMPTVAGTARYRVEFRLGGRDALPHVDRRTAGGQPQAE